MGELGLYHEERVARRFEREDFHSGWGIRTLAAGRLPELFCGFERGPGAGPTPYPVACAPQAWASGSGYLLLQSWLGVSGDWVKARVSFDPPALPPSGGGSTMRELRGRQGAGG